MDRSDLQKLATLRLEEARALLDAERYEGAYYLAGYAAECGFKACIAKRTRQDEFPDLDRAKNSYTHALDALAMVAGVRDELDEIERRGGPIAGRWSMAKDWLPSSRYRFPTEEEAVGLVDAVGNPEHGILRWLSERW